jgi:hypothetical protein
VLTEADESIHVPGTELPHRWQENMLFYGWNQEQNVGFFFHVQRMPHSGISELKAVVCDPSRSVSTTQVITMPVDRMYQGIVIEEPFRRVRLSYNGLGVAQTSQTDLPAPSDTGSVPFGMDLILTGKAGPADWNAALTTMSSTENTHYQMAGSCEGTLRYGDRKVSGSGLFWRDHTWGLRNYSAETHDNVEIGKGGHDWSWFTPMVFDEGRTLVNGLYLELADGREQTFGVLTEGEHTKVLPAYRVTVTQGVTGRPEICDYQRVHVTGGDDTTTLDCHLQVVRHLPMYLPHHGPDTVLSEAFGTATWGTRTGWGSAELMETRPDWKSRPAFADQFRTPVP